LLSLKGCIVTADELDCQRGSAAKMGGRDAEFVLALR
jgi:predicted transposase YbfD/YdcC